VTRPSVQHADITLTVGPDGVIRDAVFGRALASESAAPWVGTEWEATVTGPTRAKIRRLVSEAQASGVTGFRHVNHVMPSGSELPVEYTAVRIGQDGSIIAVGRSLKAVSELQQRLVRAQQAIERDHWHLREVETRYRLLFHSSPEAIVVVDADTLRVTDSNPAASRLVGAENRKGDLAGKPATSLFSESDQSDVESRLERARAQRTSSSFSADLPSGIPCRVRLSVMSGDTGSLLLLHMAAEHDGESARAAFLGGMAVDNLVERLPDGLVLMDGRGIIRAANRTFLDLVQVNTPAEVLNESLARWLGRPGADLTVLQSLVEQHGAARLFATSLQGELGSSLEVEISGAIARDDPRLVVLLLRDVQSRLSLREPIGSEFDQGLQELTAEIGRTSLRSLVRRTVGLVERRFIQDALELTAGNRTAAAELLGLSRQSLYSKLSKYDLDNSPNN
jgi:transcriptional regulator PpsR